jgi:HD-GYP domain-containing protein (c-di-GMP phosphodiesterase class II)
MAEKAPAPDLAGENALLREQLQAVNEIGIALTVERDLRSLLEVILTQARRLTCADAGSLYLVEGEQRDKLRFVLAQNDSRPVPFVEMVLEVADRTVVGHVARTRELINLPDVYVLPEGCDFAFSTRFDELTGYRSKSMLVVPMIDHRDQVIGCLQLINRKPERGVLLRDAHHADEVVQPFPPAAVELIRSLASQSAVAIDKARLIEDLQRTFEGLVYASVVAIESRDPTTSGHSERVARFCVELARAVEEVGGTEKLGQVSWTPAQLKELRFAALLHDFGKVGVREHVLVKAKKLYPWEMEEVRLRFLTALRSREAARWEELARRACEGDAGGPARVQWLRETEELVAQERERLLGLLAAVEEANEPRILAEGAVDRLHHVAEERWLDQAGVAHPLLDPRQVEDLSIARGSLNREQRLEIESHVVHTYRFLSRIPWTEELRRLPDIAHAHHEKLDGTGYPRGLKDVEIPLQSKIMAVADIYDALTAWDRPYKKALPAGRALEILEAEARDGKLEADLVAVFRAREVWRCVEPPRLEPAKEK